MPIPNPRVRYERRKRNFSVFTVRRNNFRVLIVFGFSVRRVWRSKGITARKWKLKVPSSTRKMFLVRRLPVSYPVTHTHARTGRIPSRGKRDGRKANTRLVLNNVYATDVFVFGLYERYLGPFTLKLCIYTVFGLPAETRPRGRRFANFHPNTGRISSRGVSTARACTLNIFATVTRAY